MDYSYPILHRVFDYYVAPEDIGDRYLICCQHLLEPQLKMFELFLAFGFDPKKIFILGKAYSSNESVITDLKKLGVNVYQPEFSGIPFDHEHRKNCEFVRDLIPGEANVVLLDDGAELITAFIDARRNVLFAVEQTSSGFRKLESLEIPFPVLNVARSETKLIQESPFIARECISKIKGLYPYNTLSSIFVVGLGPIGENILAELKKDKPLIRGFDVKHGHGDLVSEIIKDQPGMVIGATGTTILSEDELRQIKTNKPMYFVSVSSSDREFAMAGFRANNSVHDDIIFGNLIFANNGFPITFLGNRNEIEPKEIEKTICLLAGSVLYGVTQTIETAGLLNVPQDLQDMVNG